MRILSEPFSIPAVSDTVRSLVNKPATPSQNRWSGIEIEVAENSKEGVAQSVEQRTFNPLVLGSSPSALTLLFVRFSFVFMGIIDILMVHLVLHRTSPFATKCQIFGSYLAPLF